MKAKIQISGQIGGNFTLLNKLNTIDDYKKTMFGGFLINYNTIGEAKKAMKAAYKELKQECKESNCALPSISKCSEYLSYDASKAKILREE
jgi:hypothetical protein